MIAAPRLWQFRACMLLSQRAHTSRELADALDVTLNTARRFLAEASKQKLIRPAGRGASTRGMKPLTWIATGAHDA